MAAMSPHTESCIQKVNVPPHAFLSATLTKKVMISVFYAAKPRGAVMKPCFQEQH